MNTSPRNFFLVDFENTQSLELEGLGQRNARVLIFVGTNQKKQFSLAFVQKLLAAKADVELIESTGCGKNALDFQIAYHAGKLLEQNQDAAVYFVTRDKGFDPLVQRIRAEKKTAFRIESFSNLPAAVRKKETESTLSEADKPNPEHVGHIISCLNKLQNTARPRKLKTFRSFVKAQLPNQPSIDTGPIVQELIERQIVRVGENEAVTYNLNQP